MIKDYYKLFWLFGLVNNVIYVVILSAAVDLVGPTVPKSLILLVDIMPSLIVKLVCPFCIHRIKYTHRIVSLIVLSGFGMILVSLNNSNLVCTLLGIVLASISSGLGEITFLQLTNIFKTEALNGWSSGTGGAGILGSALYMLLTSLLRIPINISLLIFSILPLGFLFYFNLDLLYVEANQELSIVKKIDILQTLHDLRKLIIPYMLPLTTVYFFEYLINQAVAPTLLFPIGDSQSPSTNQNNHSFFHKYRDIYVTYSTLYQLGVFISRSSGKLVRLRSLYTLSFLQFINFLFTIYQSWNFPIKSPWPIMLLIFYEGLLGGASYVNTFLNILDDIEPPLVEFSVGAVSIADSFGVFLAAIIGLNLEPALCNHQLNDNRPWCQME